MTIFTWLVPYVNRRLRARAMKRVRSKSPYGDAAMAEKGEGKKKGSKGSVVSEKEAMGKGKGKGVAKSGTPTPSLKSARGSFKSSKGSVKSEKRSVKSGKADAVVVEKSVD